MNNSKTRTSGQPSPEDVAKIAYASPVLKVFGTVKEFTRSNTGSKTDGNVNNPGKQGSSDRRLKENVAQIGEFRTGVGLYLFDYKPEHQETCGFGRQFGVMADEVEQFMPEAVSLRPDGYKLVDYGMLGIDRAFH